MADYRKMWEDLNFTIKDMLNVYYGKSDYAKYDKSVCEWNQFLKDLHKQTTTVQ